MIMIVYYGERPQIEPDYQNIPEEHSKAAQIKPHIDPHKYRATCQTGRNLRDFCGLF